MLVYNKFKNNYCHNVICKRFRQTDIQNRSLFLTPFIGTKIIKNIVTCDFNVDFKLMFDYHNGIFRKIQL